MTVLLDLGTGAATGLTTQPQYGPSFYLSPQQGVMPHLSVVVRLSRGVLPPSINFALQAMSDDEESFGIVATSRQGQASSTRVDTLPVQTFAGSDLDHAEFFFVPSVRINRSWRCSAWVSSATQPGHRITVYSDLAVLAQEA